MPGESDMERALALNRAMAGHNLFGGAQRPLHAEQHSTFLLSPAPLAIEQEDIQVLEELGPAFYSFYQAANRLYQQSVRGSIPGFFSAYLDQGKPEHVLELGRLNRFKHQVPIVIRPDIIFTEQGPIVTELDSVPGGMGLLAFMARQYAAMGYHVLGGAGGMVTGFAAALRGLLPDHPDPLVAIVVSDESDDYRGEMTWLGQALRETGLRTEVCHPRDLVFRENGLYLPNVGRVDILYRFFELFDLKNIPQIDLILYAIRKEMVVATPPLKSQLEEKLLFALFHHPVLASVWRRELPGHTWETLQEVLPYTWVLDPRPLPPHAVIPNLTVGGEPVTDYRQLGAASQRERELVVKPSGFSPQAWGSRGVTVGHDVSSEEWRACLERALDAFGRTPHILQKFHKGKKYTVDYFDFRDRTIKRMHGRARLCPYYFVVNNEVRLAGVLATVAPLNKKTIHGMVDAVMAPVATAIKE